jgi:hypothetical protein
MEPQSMSYGYGERCHSMEAKLAIYTQVCMMYVF